MRLIRKLFQLAFIGFFVYGVYAVWQKYSAGPDIQPEPPVVSHHTVLQEITAMGKLELVKFNFRDIVEYEKGLTNFSTINYYLNKYGGNKAKAVLIVGGEAVGCIDLTQISASDIVDAGRDTLIVYLPKAELCVNKINHDQSKVYSMQHTYFVEEGQMVSEAYLAAEKKIADEALRMGILEQTDENAEKILRPFLEKTSGKTVLLRRRLEGDLSELRQ
jgi:hypothetical protein